MKDQREKLWVVFPKDDPSLGRTVSLPPREKKKSSDLPSYIIGIVAGLVILWFWSRYWPAQW